MLSSLEVPNIDVVVCIQGIKVSIVYLNGDSGYGKCRRSETRYELDILDTRTRTINKAEMPFPCFLCSVHVSVSASELDLVRNSLTVRKTFFPRRLAHSTRFLTLFLRLTYHD